MSRVGNLPIKLPKGVEVTIAENNTVTVKGPNGTLVRKVDSDMILKQEDGQLAIQRPSEQKRHKALHGLYRALLNNMIVGVSEGYKKELELIGVGYRASNTGQLLELMVGYSHPVYILLPDEVKVSTETAKGQAPTITLTSTDKELIGAVAAKIRSIRKPEPYKGKGIKFKGEVLRRKAGKTAAK